MEVYVSGLHSDPDPSPGLGVARSLRAAYPNIYLVGVDYSARSTGLHSGLFDRLSLKRPWSEISLERYRDQIVELLSRSDIYWLSGLDVEIDWLSRVVSSHPRLLNPSVSALNLVRKPAITAADVLRMQVPRSIRAGSSAVSLHRFARSEAWHLWVKAVHHNAIRARSWPELTQAIHSLSEHWGIDNIFVQQNVPGLEESYAFAAYRGRLLAAVHMLKCAVTATGKTWAGSVESVDATARARIEEFVACTNWTGGGEIEFIRSVNDHCYVIDVNPRFPAWIHGSTLCGVNLPGILLQHASGEVAKSSSLSAKQFARLVVEVPVSNDFPIPPLMHSSDSDHLAAGKHPSFQPLLAKKLRRAESATSTVLRASGDDERPAGWRAVVDLARESSSTPIRVAIPGAVLERVDGISKAVEGFAHPSIVPALSIKSHPSTSLIAAVAGDIRWWAEAISEVEVRRVIDHGFTPNRVVLNGPSPNQFANSATKGLGVVFHDSIESFRRDECEGRHVKGLRLRLPDIPSRFGVPLDDWRAFGEVVDAIASLPQHGPFGLHFHYPSDVLGLARWWTRVDALVDWARRITHLAKRAVLILDVGGGWHHEDFDRDFVPGLDRLWRTISRALPSVETILFEPGKAVSGPTYALVASVSEVRRGTKRDGREIIVDASIADMPMARAYAHPIAAVSRANGRVVWPGLGRDRVFGSICMETDVLAEGLDFGTSLEAGDLMIFFDAGGYNASMAWEFARGRTRDGV